MSLQAAQREILTFTENLLQKHRFILKFHWSIQGILKPILIFYVNFVAENFEKLLKSYTIQRQKYRNEIASLKSIEARQKLRGRRLRVEEYAFYLNEYKGPGSSILTSNQFPLAGFRVSYFRSPISAGLK